MNDKRQVVLKGFIWSFAEKMLIQIVAFVIGIILARKLGPNTFGVVATASVIISIITICTNLYTGTYLMRKKDVDSLDLNTSFYFNIAVSFVLYLILFFIAPLIANFYGVSELRPLIRTMGITLLFSPLMGAKLILIVRNYQQKKLFFASLIGTVIAGVAGISLAFTGFGPWALVAQHCLDGVIDAIILWFVVKWSPKKEFSFKRLKEMAAYGLPLWAFGVLETLSTRVHSLIIGKKYSSLDLAFYNKGESIPSMIEANTTSSLNTVLLRRVSEDQDDIHKAGSTLITINKVSLFIAFPTMFGLAAVSSAIIYVLLGGEWMESVIYMNLFCIAFAFKPIETTSDITLKAIGKSKEFFVFGSIKKALFLIAVFATVFISVKAIAIGFVVASLLATLVSVIVNRVIIKISIFSQIKSILLPLISAFIMYIFIQRLSDVFAGIPIPLVLLIQVVFGIIIYFLNSLVFNKDIIDYLFEFSKQMFKKKK